MWPVKHETNQLDDNALLAQCPQVAAQLKTTKHLGCYKLHFPGSCAHQISLDHNLDSRLLGNWVLIVDWYWVLLIFRTRIAHPASSWLDDYFDWIGGGGNPPCCRQYVKSGDFCASTGEWMRICVHVHSTVVNAHMCIVLLWLCWLYWWSVMAERING